MATYRQFDHYNIRDTNTHLPQYPLVSMRGKEVLMCQVQNGTNQPVTAQLIGNSSSATSGSTTFANALRCGANVRSNMSVTKGEFWNQYLGVQLTFPVAPTQGDVTVRIWTEDGKE